MWSEGRVRRAIRFSASLINQGVFIPIQKQGYLYKTITFCIYSMKSLHIKIREISPLSRNLIMKMWHNFSTWSLPLCLNVMNERLFQWADDSRSSPNSLWSNLISLWPCFKIQITSPTLPHDYAFTIKHFQIILRTFSWCHNIRN